MDIEEIKKYSKNKIEADNLIKQVRQKIKETTWEKQNLREGFTETFKPLISQFEDPGEDSKKQNIFTQNQKMLQNQLALTKGLKANQKAITDGFSQFERLADMKELPGVEDFDDGEQKHISKDQIDFDDDKEQSDTEKTQKKPPIYDIEKNFEEEELKTLENKFGFPRPNNFFDIDSEILKEYYEEVNKDKTIIGNKIGGLKRTKKKTKEQEDQLAIYTKEHGLLNKYKNIINTYLSTLDLQVGQGLYFSPQELLHRFELLNGSLVAGNNGVLPEFIQIAHRLRDLGILSNNQLNKLLRKVI